MIWSMLPGQVAVRQKMLSLSTRIMLDCPKRACAEQVRPRDA